MLSETEIYLGIKSWLKKRNWEILGGEPPGGTNDIPIIEIKNSSYEGKGSHGSKKLDLVAYKEGYFMLLELKRRYSESDIVKLDLIVGEKSLRAAFLRALDERRILKRIHVSLPSDIENYTSEATYFIKAVGFNYTGKLAKDDYVTFIPSGSTMRAIVGSKIEDGARKLFSDQE